MSVYVDDARHRYGRMIMCHMIADTDAELLAMADQIGVQRKWHQKPGTPHSHFDVCRAKRDLAIKAGAIQITGKDLGRIIVRRRNAAWKAYLDWGESHQPGD